MSTTMQFIGSILLIGVGGYVAFLGGSAVFLMAGFAGRTSYSGIIAAIVGCVLICFGFAGLPLDVQISTQ